jgi:hypothetical protein
MSENPQNMTKNGVADSVCIFTDRKCGVTCLIEGVTDLVVGVPYSIVENNGHGNGYNGHGNRYNEHGNGYNSLGNRYIEPGNERNKPSNMSFRTEGRNLPLYVIPAKAGIQRRRGNSGFPIKSGMTNWRSGMTRKNEKSVIPAANIVIPAKAGIQKL